MSTQLHDVTPLPAHNIIHVRWRVTEVVGDQTTQRWHRKAYAEHQAAEFAAEVEGAESYLATMGWTA